MNANLIINIISFLYFNSPIIISVIFILISIISLFRGYDFQLNKLIGGIVGILSVIITSIFLAFLPKESVYDAITLWIFKTIFPLFILYAIADASEGKYTGIKGLFFILIFGAGITLIDKLA